MSTEEGKTIERTYLFDTLVTSFGDGLMTMRHLMEAFPGQALIDKAIDPTSPYAPSNWNAVATNIENLMV